MNTMPGIGDIAGAGPGFDSLGVSTCKRAQWRDQALRVNYELNVIFSAPVGLKCRGEHVR